MARVDEMLPSWHASPDGYDPRIVGPALDELAEMAAHIVRKSGRLTHSISTHETGSTISHTGRILRSAVTAQSTGYCVVKLIAGMESRRGRLLCKRKVIAVLILCGTTRLALRTHRGWSLGPAYNQAPEPTRDDVALRASAQSRRRLSSPRCKRR